MTKLDKMLSEILKLERGPACEIHNRTTCDRVGAMHLLSKMAHPRLRYCKDNILLCGWFCGHFYSHHAFDDKRAEYVRERIAAIRGPDWKDKLYEIERFAGKHDDLYLMALEQRFKAELNALS